MGNDLLKEKVHAVWATAPKDWTGAASVGDYVKLNNHDKVEVLIQTGAWAAGTAAVTLEQATSAAGAGTKALAFTKQYTSTGLTDDSITEVAVTSNTFDLSAANKLHRIEVEASDLDLANGFNWLTVKVASPGANADLYGALYLMHGSRYQQASPPTVIA